MADCLTPAQVEALLADALSPSEKALVEAHIAECENCRNKIEAQGAENRLFGDIKRAYHGETVERKDQPGESARPPVSDSIEGYEILREIHRGGQGVVYQAIQKATKRKVAIKVMREGPFASSRDKARFDREVQILGQ